MLINIKGIENAFKCTIYTDFVTKKDMKYIWRNMRFEKN